jgi:hypothetical protein
MIEDLVLQCRDEVFKSSHLHPKQLLPYKPLKFTYAHNFLIMGLSILCIFSKVLKTLMNL